MTAQSLPLPSLFARAMANSATLKPLLITGSLVLIVMSMVVPMPAWLLDAGFALSIATAMLILVMASLVEKPTDFQAFPVLLLVSLVIRLSLTVSSTRLILTEGDKGKDAAGHVISGFAQFVAGGSLLIGLTVFAVISVVNFLVITKGSGRMAEVAARFALDSLPGKQLAIDGDLNSGAIDHEEAKQRRIHEQREISFYGSLDGASKFVKGDAIAGLVITMINLIVGLAAGILVHAMPASEALSTYSHLTIGDGLVAQIPALITSMAAALLLSRGGASGGTAELLLTQFGRNWQAPAIVGFGLLVMALIPGMPYLVFVFLAMTLGAAAYFVHKRGPEAAVEERPSEIAMPVGPQETRIGDVLDTDEVSVEISPMLIDMAVDPLHGLAARIANLRLHIASSFGVILPDVRITDGKDFADGDYIIRIHGAIRGRGKLISHSVMALASKEILAEVPGALISEPVYGSPAKWVGDHLQDEAAMSGATIITPMEVLSTHLLEVIKSNLPHLLTLSGLQRLIQELRSVTDEKRALHNQRFFDSLVPDKVAPELLLTVLRSLLAERVSIRNLILIVDAVHEAKSAETPAAIGEIIRKKLRSQITEQLLSGEGGLDILQLHPQWEAEFARVEAEASRQGQLPVLQLQRRLVETVQAAVTAAGPDLSPVLIVPDHRRRFVRNVLESGAAGMPVLGFDEIDPSANVRVIGNVGL